MLELTPRAVLQLRACIRPMRHRVEAWDLRPMIETRGAAFSRRREKGVPHPSVRRRVGVRIDRAGDGRRRCPRRP
jgi:hypothetical protein